MSFAARTGAIAGVGARALTPRRARRGWPQARGGSPAPACVTNASTALGTWTPTPDGLRRRARCHAVDSTAGLLASMDEQDITLYWPMDEGGTSGYDFFDQAAPLLILLFVGVLC